MPIVINDDDLCSPDLRCDMCDEVRRARQRQFSLSDLGFNEDPDEDGELDLDDEPYIEPEPVREPVRVQDYSYTPPLKFLGRGPLYFGMELELTTGWRQRAAEIVADEMGDRAWTKRDGSVEGVEIVTMPMSYAYAMREVPWDSLLGRLEDEAECRGGRDGIHIHVSKDGFASHIHQYIWMKLIYRNQREVERIAGRSGSSWAKFDPKARSEQQMLALLAKKYPKLGSYSLWNEANGHERQQVELAGAPDRYSGYLASGDRYMAINTTNDHTFEVRVFASTTDPAKAKARLQLVASTVEYAGELNSAKALKGGWDWRNYRAWMFEHSEKYPQLTAML